MLSLQSRQFLPDHAIEHQFVFQGYLKVVMFVSLQQTQFYLQVERGRDD